MAVFRPVRLVRHYSLYGLSGRVNGPCGVVTLSLSLSLSLSLCLSLSLSGGLAPPSTALIYLTPGIAKLASTLVTNQFWEENPLREITLQPGQAMVPPPGDYDLLFLSPPSPAATRSAMQYIAMHAARHPGRKYVLAFAPNPGHDVLAVVREHQGALGQVVEELSVKTDLGWCLVIAPPRCVSLGASCSSIVLF